jgi:tRNA nucleotidyltransferase/poly(A) polymerase
MGDYLFQIETHFSAAQLRVVRAVQEVCNGLQWNLFLTGGALRDLLGGYPTRDLDFTVEGEPRTVAKGLSGFVEIVREASGVRRMELRAGDGAIFELHQAVEERYPKPGAKPTATPATIYEDLKSRDFTMNAMALSLSRASRGLLLDPLNGRSDLEAKSIRAATTTALYDDPARLLRLVRFRTRLQMSVDERTQRQFRNAIESEMPSLIGRGGLERELAAISNEAEPLAVFEALRAEGLLGLFGEGLAAMLNAKAFERWTKARAAMPFGTLRPPDGVAVLLWLLSQGLTAKDKALLLKGLPVSDESAGSFQKLSAAVARLEKRLAEPSSQRLAAMYEALAEVPGEQIVVLLMQSSQRMVVDRMKRFLQMGVPLVQGVTDQDVVAQGLDPSTAKGQAKRKEIIRERLNAKPKKDKEPPPPPEPVRPYARRRL